MTAANDPTRIPPLTPATRERLRRAYEKTELARHGKSFEDALGSPCLLLALGNIAAALERPRHETPGRD